jgi:uncharacterized protein (DUF302 family)
MDPNLGDGLVHITSHHSVPETVERLESLLRAQGIALFCRINHSAEAIKVGLEMRPTQVLIFGSPKSGTPLMVAAPSLAIDLPLKALIWEDAGGAVRISFNSPEYLQRRHGIPNELLANIAGIGTLVQKAAS